MLKVDKALTVILFEHIDFINVFSLVLVIKLLKYIEINNLFIRLIVGSSIKVNNIGIINKNSTKSVKISKLAKSKNLIQ